ncbi:zinc finger protein 888-like [Mytilus trossulus]|uniref:zinc finger protein 888-like n=1 Tax=Mytilus trossulus TaxID=6551 RepID=UPI0030040D70
MGKTTDGETSIKKETMETEDTETGTRKSQRLRLKPVQRHTKTIKEKKNLKNCNKNLKSLQVYLKNKKKEKKNSNREKKADSDAPTISNIGYVKIKSDTTCKLCNLNLKTEHKFHYHMKTQHKHDKETSLKRVQGSIKCKKTKKKSVQKAKSYTTSAIIKDVEIKSEEEIETQTDNSDDGSLDSTKSVKCKLCQKGYKKLNGLSQHLRLTHKTYCIHCEENMSSVDELKEHLNKTHNIFASEDGSFKYGCKICGKTFANGHKLKAHEYVHNIHPPLKCSICHQILKSEKTLSYHMKTKHNDAYQKNVSCEYCGKLFWCKSELDKHSRVHTNERPYLCHICSSSFKTAGNLRNHQRAIHENHFWFCDVCGQKFKSKPRFQEHLYKEKHGKEGKPIQYKEFPCNECGKIFPRKIDFQIHFRIHSGAKPYKCVECGRSFRCHNHLTQHKVTHTGEKPFICKFCGKGFSQYANVNCHMKKQCKFKGQENKNISTFKEDSTQIFDHSLMLNESSIRLVAPPGVNKIKQEKKPKAKEPNKPENTSWKVKHVSADIEGPEEIHINHKGTQSDFSLKTENEEEVKSDKIVDFLVDNIVEDMLNDVRNITVKKQDGSHDGSEEIVKVVSAVKNVGIQDGNGEIINVVDTCKEILGRDHKNKHASQERSCRIINILKDDSQNDKCGVVNINKDGGINDECEIIKNVDKEIQQLPSDIEGGILQPEVFTAEPHVSEVSNFEDKSNLALTDNHQIMILRNDDMQESKVVLAEITENGMMRYIPVPITDQDGTTMFVLDPANTEHSKTYHNQYDLLKGHAERETIHIYTQQGLATACLPQGVETVTRPQGQESVGEQQVLESAGEQQVLESVGGQQVLESVGGQQVLESVGEQQVLESVGGQHCFENTTNAEKIDQDGFEPMEVTYSSMYSLSEMKSAENDI